MEAPKEYKDGGLAILVSGVFNIMTAGIWILTLIWVCVGILWVIPLAIGCWQAFVGLQVYQGKPQPSAKMAAIAGIVAGVFNVNPIAILGGVLGMMNVGKEEAVAFLESNS